MTRIGVILGSNPLPHLDEPLPPSMGQYQNTHTQDWAATISRFDGFVFVTPEYNHSTSGVLKNAIDFRYAQWNNKAMGVVWYGVTGGTRVTDFKPIDRQAQVLDTLFGEVIAWSQALAPLRRAAQAA